MTAFTAREATSSCNQLFSTLRLLLRKLYRRHISTLIIKKFNKKPRVMLCTLRDPDIIHCSPTIALCKWMQHCWLTTPNIVGCFILCLLAQSCVLLGVVAPCLKVVKPLSQQLPTFLLFHALYTWSPLSLQSLMGCILPTMSCCIRSPPPPPPGGDSHMKGAGMLVSLRGENFGFWSHLG